jgi:cytochrome c oxidase subunit 2
MIGGIALVPHHASTVALQVDAITVALIVACGAMLLFIVCLILSFCVLYRKGTERNRTIDTRGENKLEWAWALATLGVFLALFGWGAVVYFKMHAPPAGATEISVVAKQWMWKFQHANGKRELDELHVPVNVPVVLTMTSQDVIHSFFVPEFRVKQDVLPGRYSRLWFEATRVGEYHLFCAQYCGTLHAGMTGRVVVMSQADYARWLESGAPAEAGAGRATMASRGGRLFTRLGCISCHGTNAGVTAPTLAGIFGQPVGLSDGTTVAADENYLRESILNPRAKITLGYQPVMPPFAGVISEEEVLDLIAYLKSLKGTPTGASDGS